MEINKGKNVRQTIHYKHIIKIKKWLDDYYLDGIIGLIPIVGDFSTLLFNFSYFYIAIVYIKSFRLTVALLHNALLDFLLGSIPYIGIVADFFFKSYKSNLLLIDGYIDKNPEIIKSVNRKTIYFIILIMLIIAGIYAVVKLSIYLITEMYHWILSIL